MANSNTSKAKLVIENILGYSLVILVPLIVLYGAWWVITTSEKDSVKRCEENVQLTGAKEWKYDSGSCYIIKDGKIEEIK